MSFNVTISTINVLDSQSPMLDRLVPILNKAVDYFSKIENSVYDDCKEPTEYYDNTIINNHLIIYTHDEVKDEITGVLLLQRWHSDFMVVYLNDLWVEPAYRGRGVATHLVEYAIKYAKEHGRHIELGWLENGGDGKHFWKSFIECHDELNSQKLHTWISLC